VRIHQDAAVYATLLDGDEALKQAVAAGRRIYVHVARGEVTLNGHPLSAGDALKAEGERELVFERGRGAEVLLFDLP
jgi:redox-sensitive bicupin YhaK (pirin superfamily)